MGRGKKKKTSAGKNESEELVNAPHSFIIKRGDVGKYVDKLMHDFRRVMEPFTASDLKVRRKNSIRDFVSISSMLNVTHMSVFTRTDKSPYFRLCRLPRGPTITYKIKEYTLAHDVIASIRKPHINSSLFHAAPLLVLNGFSQNENDIQFKLQSSMWRNMFPSIDIHNVVLDNIKRCVLLNYDQESGLIEFRHYAIKVKPVGLSNTVRKIITGKKVPDLGSFTSVEEAIKRGEIADFTESEGEQDEVDETRHVKLPQQLAKRGNLRDETSAIRLVELGPRMKLELVKIEEGILSGEVLYHSYIQKTPEEIAALKKNASQKAYLKLSRKKEQEANVKRKTDELEGRDNRKTKRMKSLEEAKKKGGKDDNKNGDDGGGGGDDEVEIDEEDAKLFKDDDFDDDDDDDEIERYDD